MKEEKQVKSWKYSELTISTSAFLGSLLCLLLIIQGNTIVVALLGLTIVSTIFYYFPIKTEFFSRIKLKGKKVWILYFLGALSILLYLVSGSNSTFGIISFLLILVIAVNEFLPEDKGAQGIKKGAAEVIYSVLFAVGLWTILTLTLSTQTPINVVTSCSMLPTLQRGDLLLLKGGIVNTQEIKLNTTYQQFVNNMIPIPEPCIIQENGTNKDTRCINSILYNKTKYNFTKQGDIIVYTPQVKIAKLKPYLQGIDLIVHRAVLKITATDGTYIITKGDNNPTPDQIVVTSPNVADSVKTEKNIRILCFDDSKIGEICTITPWIEPTEEKNILGKNIFRIPIIGYIKLLLFAQTQEPANCKQILVQ